MADLRNKRIVLAGSNGRLGRLMADRFRTQGATLITVDRAVPDGAPATAFTADVTDEASVEACFSRIEEAFDRIDALVHVVGMWTMKPIAETTLSDWRTVMDVNLTSVFLCFREALKRMHAAGSGRLIGIASAQGADGGVAQQAAYSASKAGVIRLVEAVAEEYKGQGITAHAIAPSTLLFDGKQADQTGVTAEALIDLCTYLLGSAGEALSGATLRAYGIGRAKPTVHGRA